jgi:hypothetical protein
MRQSVDPAAAAREAAVQCEQAFRIDQEFGLTGVEN